MAGVPSYAKAQSLNEFNHIVVIYQENHSFDNLYGFWGDVNGQHLRGQADADPAHTTQLRQDNVTAYQCLLQNDVNLTSPSPLATTCTDNTGANSFQSAFTNRPFAIEDFIASTDTTCPNPNGAFAANGFRKGTGLTGGCTKDIVHRYYNEQYQINGGRQNRYVTGSDASGLSMGFYNTARLPIYVYLHSAGAPNYIIADSFYQSAFGGSFLNHQWFVAAASPVFAGAANDGSATDLHSVVDNNGMPTSTPLYTSPLGSRAIDAQLTASCNPPASRPATPPGIACGDFAVNTTQPFVQPFSPGTADARRLPPLTNPTIGDRLSAKQVDWAWYSGGWSNANGDVGAAGWTNGIGSNNNCTDPNHHPAAVYPLCPDVNFQFHHQAFNYFANYAPGTAARKAHLRDEAEFIQAAQNGTLKAVSFIKPLGEENEHPGYTNETEGSHHLVDLIRAIVEGPNGLDTLIIITYDEFGGQWDHMPPPPYGRKGRDSQAADIWGPGTRIPALLVSKRFQQSRVAHADYDTTSILKLIEKRFALAPLVARPVRSLSDAFDGNEGHLASPSTHDFNKDGKSDVLWANSSSGQVVQWLVDGSNVIGGGSPGSLPSPWAVVGQRDFNGDGFADVLWRNGTTGQLLIWLLNSSAVVGSGSPGTAASPWFVAGTGDFNGDGFGDVLWSNSSTGQLMIWFLNGTNMIGGGSPGGAASPWMVAGTGDFNGDGFTDILWWHSISGQLVTWFLNGTTLLGGGSPGSAAPPWQPFGTGDFNGDGFTDVVWRNSSTGQAVVWLMNGTSVIGGGSPGSVATNWAIAETGDFNGDSKSDILWVNSTSGQLVVWLVNGTSVSGGGSPGSAPTPWQVQGMNAD